MRHRLSKARLSSLRVFIIIIAAIFVAEVVAMIAVYFIEPLPYHLTALVDAGIMTILIFPVLYYFSFRPLIREMKKSWQAEESLLQARQLQERFFDSIDTLIAYMDREFNLIRVNDAYARTVGQTPDYFTGRNHFELYPNTENEAIFNRVVETGEAFSVYEKAFEYPDQPDRGITYWNWSLQPVKNLDGRVEGLVLSLVDVTERKRAEEQLRKAYEDLEQRVQERTEELRVANSELEQEIAERKHKEEQLRHQAALLSNVNDAIVASDAQFRITTWNAAAESLYGWRADEVIGHNGLEIVRTEWPEEDSDEMRRTIAETGRWRGEATQIRKNGLRFPVEISSIVLRDGSGQIRDYISVNRDITERKQAEDALRESERLLNRAEEIAHLGSWELDLVTNRLTWSDEVYRIFGFQPQEFGASYDTFLEVVHPEDRAAVDAAYSESIREGKDSYEIEHRVIKRQSGEVRFVHEKCEHFRNESGEILRSAGMVHDITERRKSEEALRESETKYRNLFENMTEEVHFWQLVRDPEDRIKTWRLVDANPPTLKTWNRKSIDEIKGRTTDEIFGAGSTEHYMPVVQKIMNEGVPHSFEDYFSNLDKYFRFTSVPLGDHFITTGADITTIKKAEETLRLAHDELERRVQERTEELNIANGDLRNEILDRREIERQLRTQATAMNAAANGIVITDRQGNIQWINPALVQMSGFQACDLIGQNMHIFKSGKQDTAYYRELWDTILSGQVWRGETTNRRKDGSFYVEEQTITPVLGDHGEIAQFIAIKQDITERKHAEKEISEQNQKEKILTQTIHTMQLDIARDLHDTIGQNIGFLRMKLDYLAEKQIRKRAEMQSEIRSMARVADESYDLMRGTLAVLQSENSTDLFRLFTRYAEQIENRSAFKVDLSTRGEPRFMSAKRMRQLFYIFREIVNNIEKHANASEVSIKMSWDRDCLSLVVFDNGSGFELDKVQYGSHYGLKFMRERVELLNGSILIRSAIGSGTEILLQVPYE